MVFRRKTELWSKLYVNINVMAGRSYLRSFLRGSGIGSYSVATSTLEAASGWRVTLLQWGHHRPSSAPVAFTCMLMSENGSHLQCKVTNCNRWKLLNCVFNCFSVQWPFACWKLIFKIQLSKFLYSRNRCFFGWNFHSLCQISNI